MGLDAVELVMEIEDTFCISIPDDVTSIATVGDMSDYIVNVLKDRGRSRCYSGHCFRRLQKALAESLNLPPRELRPSTRFDSFIQPENANRIYDKLKETLTRQQYTLPCICNNVGCLIILISACLIVGGLFSFINTLPSAFSTEEQDLGRIGFAASLLAILLGVAMAILQKVFGHPNHGLKFFRKYPTLGDVASAMAAKLDPKILDNASPLPTEVEKIVISITAEVLQIAPEKIKRESRFVEDLGVD